MTQIDAELQMVPAAETKVKLKSPIILAIVSLTQLLFFGIFGKTGDIKFVWSGKQDTFQLQPFFVNSAFFNTVAGSILLCLALISSILYIRNQKTPLAIILLFGAVSVVSLLGWLATGADQGVQIVFILNNTLMLATPLILGAMAGVMSERVGVVNIAIEGQLLTGAFVSSVVGSVTNNLYLGLIVAMVASALLSMVLASLSIKYLVDQVIIGVLLNVLVLGVTNYLYSSWLENDSDVLNDPGTFEKINIPFLSDIPIIGPSLFDNNIIVFLMFLIVPLLWYFLYKTKLGIRARAVGEHPLAADTVGINVGQTRFWWVTLGGLLAGMGGASLTIGSIGPFGHDMSNGQGYIALAVVILGRWNPLFASLSALLFGFAILLRVWANQVSPGIPSDFIIMVPYLVTLVAVAGFAGKVRPPAASGQPYEKG